MNYGLSLLLHEYVAATAVDYGDPATFQIVCPECREAIFKAGRFGGERQYFSHYSTSRSDVKLCELRVASLTAEHINHNNSIGRRQALEAFFENFQRRVVKWLYPDDAEAVRRRVVSMTTRESFITYATFLRDSMRKNDFDRVASQIIDGVATDQSSYWVWQQKRFATDFLIRLSAENFSGWLFALALAIFASKAFQGGIRETLVFDNDHRLKRMLTKMRNTPPGDRELAYLRRHVTLWKHTDYSKSHMLAIGMTSSIYLLLLCIPYVDLVNETLDTEVCRRNRQFLFSII